jgi:hypothetical protein
MDKLIVAGVVWLVSLTAPSRTRRVEADVNEEEEPSEHVA